MILMMMMERNQMITFEKKQHSFNTVCKMSLTSQLSHIHVRVGINIVICKEVQNEATLYHCCNHHDQSVVLSPIIVVEV